MTTTTRTTTSRKQQATESSPVVMWHDSEELRWAARHWAANIGVKPPVIQLRQMRTKWGAVSTAGRMTLNTDLLTLPRPLGEFVIVHELVHLLAPNHGKVFKLYMHAYLPDWQRREQELQTHSKDTLTAPPAPPRRGEGRQSKRGQLKPHLKV